MRDNPLHSRLNAYFLYFCPTFCLLLVIRKLKRKTIWTLLKKDIYMAILRKNKVFLKNV